MSGRPTVYVPSLTGGDKLAACLESLVAQTVETQVVVADNGQGEGCFGPDLRASFPSVERVAFGRNLGFGAALNRAVAAHGDGPIVLLNDDAVAEPDFVERLLEAWDGGAVAMVAGVMVDGAGRIDSAGVVADTTMLGFDHLQGQPLESAAVAAPPLGPTGGGALYDRGAFESVGGFDERIFLYYEDLDLAARIRLAGGSCALAPRALARHGFSETLGAGSAGKYAHTGWSRGYVIGRYRVGPPLDVLRVLVVEGAVCLGQMALDRTAAGLRSRVAGWRAGRALPARRRPDGLMPARAGEAIRRKLLRRNG